MLTRVLFRPELHVFLQRVQETASGQTFILSFVEPNLKLQQSVILPKSAPWEAMEEAWDRIHEQWRIYADN